MRLPASRLQKNDVTVYGTIVSVRVHKDNSVRVGFNNGTFVLTTTTREFEVFK